MQRTEQLSQATEVRLVAAAENYARFAIGPVEHGYGVPLGNAFRRVLLSSIPGAAITRIKIAGMMHEFAALPGVLEDGTQLVLNIKGIRLRCYSERPVTLHLVKQGSGPVVAGDIEVPSTAEIVNPGHYICTLDGDDALLDIQLTAERGRGATLADGGANIALGEIQVDALFSPVIKSHFVVEALDNTSERVLLEIVTDGTVKPGDALSHAAQILSRHFTHIAVGVAPAPSADADEAPLQEIPAELATRAIDELGLSTRTYNSLRRAGIGTVGQLLALPERDLNTIRNLGPKGLEEIRARIAALTARGGLPEDDTGTQPEHDTISQAPR